MGNFKKIFGTSIIVTVFLLAGCGGGGGGENQNDLGSDCSTEGWCGEQPITIAANFNDAEAIFTVQENDSAVSSLSADKSLSLEKETVVSDKSPLYSVLASGEIQEALTASTETASNALGQLPQLTFAAVSPIGDVILAFEHKFMYTECPDGYRDPWSPSSPCTCQIFVVNQRINEFSSDGDTSDVTCITNTHELDTWNFKTSRIQFDSSGDAYFSAHVPQNWKNVILRWNASSGTLSEVINSNICVRDFTVTDAGGLLYTGITSTSGDCYGDSFLRWLSPDDELVEVTRGWWNYVQQPIERGIHAGKILFFGPNPTEATTPDWNDSCMYRFDPEVSGSSRSTEIADCEIDIWNYVNNAATLALQRTRCVEEKTILGGNNQPKKIILADAYDAALTTYGDPDGVEEIYVIGNVMEKLDGTYYYDVETGLTTGHCVDSNGNLTSATTQGACTGTWNGTTVDNYNRQSSVPNPIPNDWQTNHEWCEAPGGDWRTTYSAIARINYDDDDPDSRSITRLSSDDHAVTNGWVINIGGVDRLFFAAYNAEEGVHELLEVGNNTALLSGIEVYELFADPSSSSQLYLNALRFSDNSYITGTFNPDADDPQSTLEVTSGITGQIETLVIFPDL